MREARGKYIIFIDQDDYFHSDGLARLYEAMCDEDLDVFVSDSAFEFKGHPHNRLQLNLPYREACTGEEFMLKNGAVFAPWRLAVRREFYLERELWFVENTRLEDVDWAMRVMFHARRVMYKPLLLVHYIKGEEGTTDNMYRDRNVLIAHTEAAGRTLAIANTLYAESPAKRIVMSVVHSYYNYTCRYLMGSVWSVRHKREIIALISLSSSPYRLVRLALYHPTLYAVASNCAVPLFRLARRVRRWRKARHLAG